MISAQEGFKRLREGNRRFVEDIRDKSTSTSQKLRSELVEGQEPFAVILSCSDSRVPPEIIFDQGLGDLFVIRVAGNIIAPPEVGSIEFAVDKLGTRLVVVMGHSTCGGVLATLDEIENPSENLSPNLGSIVDCIRPQVEPLLETELRENRDDLVSEAIRANVRASANHLRNESQILEQAIQKDKLVVLGAVYSLETGVVEFIEGVAGMG